MRCAHATNPKRYKVRVTHLNFSSKTFASAAAVAVAFTKNHNRPICPDAHWIGKYLWPVHRAKKKMPNAVYKFIYWHVRSQIAWFYDIFFSHLLLLPSPHYLCAESKRARKINIQKHKFLIAKNQTRNTDTNWKFSNCISIFDIAHKMRTYTQREIERIKSHTELNWTLPSIRKISFCPLSGLFCLLSIEINNLYRFTFHFFFFLLLFLQTNKFKKVGKRRIRLRLFWICDLFPQNRFDRKSSRQDLLVFRNLSMWKFISQIIE